MTTATTCKDHLQSYLREHGVSFTCRRHPEAFTARAVAASEHIPGDELAKPVVVLADGRMVMLVLPASYMVHTGKFAAALGAHDVRLAHEADLAPVFTDCEVGALPPFGNLYGLNVYVDQTIARNSRIEFRAGSHTETIGLQYTDFARLVRPTIVDAARHR
jgi:Ala-tRNA(Pro) deacylase